ncbi:unnamed protein product, partial [Darwinula stevensoni]
MIHTTTTLSCSAMEKSNTATASGNGPIKDRNGPFQGHNGPSKGHDVSTSSNVQPQLQHESSSSGCEVFEMSERYVYFLPSGEYVYLMISKNQTDPGKRLTMKTNRKRSCPAIRRVRPHQNPKFVEGTETSVALPLRCILGRNKLTGNIVKEYRKRNSRKDFVESANRWILHCRQGDGGPSRQ